MHPVYSVFSTVLEDKSVKKMEEEEEEERSYETSKAQYIYYVAFYMKLLPTSAIAEWSYWYE